MRWTPIALVLLWACKDRETGTVRLFTDAEVATLESAAMQRIDENAAMKCPRPLLRGAATPGVAGDNMTAIVEPTGLLAGCSKKIHDAQPAGKLDDLIASRTPTILAIEKECGSALETAVLASVSHDDGCSAYQVGRRAIPEEFMPALQAAHVLGLRARLRAESGNALGALWLIADGVRFFQDLRRGHTSMVIAMVGAAGESILLKQAAAVLDGAQLPQADATALLAAFDLLLASEPHPSAMMRGETDHLALYLAVPTLKPGDWVPPGGTTPHLRELGKHSDEFAKRLNPRDLAGLLLAEFAEHAKSIEAACPPTASIKSCHEALKASETAKPSPDAIKDPAKAIAALQQKYGNANTADARDKARLEVQRMLLDGMAALARPNYGEYPAKLARTYARLAAARHALAARSTGSCPGIAPALERLGDSLVFETAAGSTTIRAPAWAARPDDEQAWTLHCK